MWQSASRGRRGLTAQGACGIEVSGAPQGEAGIKEFSAQPVCVRTRASLEEVLSTARGAGGTEHPETPSEQLGFAHPGPITLLAGPQGPSPAGMRHAFRIWSHIPRPGALDPAACGPACATHHRGARPSRLRGRRRLGTEWVAHGVLCLINVAGISLSGEEELPGRPRLLEGQPRGPLQEGSHVVLTTVLWTCVGLGLRDRQGPWGRLGLGEATEASAPPAKSQEQDCSPLL